MNNKEKTKEQLIQELTEMSRRVSELEKAEKKLSENKIFMKGVFDSIQDGISILDKNLNILHVNNAMKKWYSHMMPLSGKSCFYAYHKRSEPCVVCPSIRAMEKGMLQMDMVPMTGPDGIKGWLELFAFPHKDIDGNIIGVVEYVRDISERKKAEEKLQESETRVARFGEILEASLNEIYTFDAETLRFILVNKGARENLGYSMDELKNCTPLDLKPEFTSESFVELIKPLKEGKKDKIQFTTVHRRKDGSLYPAEVYLQLFSSESKAFFLAVILDITERKQADEERSKLEEQMRQTQKLESLGVLAGGIAHDFNNILTSVLGNADLALHSLSPASPAIESIKEIRNASIRAADLSNQMLAYSGKGSFLIESTGINPIVKEMTRLLEVSISKKHTIKYDLAENLPTIKCDITQIRQVIMNLITNASEAIGDKSGAISITTGAEKYEKAYLKNIFPSEKLPGGLYVYVKVEDTGIGMNRDTIERIFDPFFTTKFTGRGLGMSAVLGIIRGHEGAIKIDSEPGKGTKFTILLPPAKETLSGIKPLKEALTSSWKGTGTALLVDDDKNVRSVGTHMLEEFGFTVVTAEDGREAIEVFRNHSDEVTCVLLDLMMPKMDGEECFRELRKIKNDICVVMISGYTEEEVSEKFIEEGFKGFLQKPFTLNSLRNKLRKALEAL